MISAYLVCVTWPTYLESNVVSAALNLRNRKENKSSCVHVLHNTLNAVISRRCFAEDDKEIVPKLIAHVQSQCFANRPFPSCCEPPYESEAKCKT